MCSERSRKSYPQTTRGGCGDGNGSNGGGFMGFGSVVKTYESTNDGNAEGDVNCKHGGEISYDIYRSIDYKVCGRDSA